MSRSTTRIASLVAALAATVAPAAQAAHGPGSIPAPSSSASDLQDAQLGPKYVTVPSATATQPAAVVAVATPSGFAWHDAAIGAGAAALVVVTAAGATAAVSHHRHGRPPFANA